MRPQSKSRSASDIIARTPGPFRAHGWEVTPDQIAEACNTDSESVLEHFPALRTLVRAAYATQIVELEQAIAKANRAAASMQSAKKLKRAIIRFVSDLTNALERRPLLAMALLPSVTDPWTMKHPRAKTQTVTLDKLAQAFYELLKAYWQTSQRPAKRASAACTARYHIRAMISAAGHRCIDGHIAYPVLDAVL